MVGALVRILAFLVVLGGIGLAGYAYLGDLDPVRERVTEPVDLDLDR